MDIAYLLAKIFGSSNCLTGVFLYVISLLLSLLFGLMRLEFDGMTIGCIPIWILLLVISMSALFRDSILENKTKNIIRSILIGVAILMIPIGYLVGLFL